MSFEETLNRRIRERLKRDFRFEDSGAWMRRGTCPACNKRELYVAAERPRFIRCGRLNNCGHEADVRDLYPDLFADWSELTRGDPNPTAAADAYLSAARGFDLLGLRPAYSQELFRDPKRPELVSATVRFALPGGAWWERIIDRPERFGARKANFSPVSNGPSYQGQAWLYPGTTIADCAAADQIWFDEGIFDTIALEQGDFRAARDTDHPCHREQGATEEGGDPIPGAPVELIHAAALMSCNNWPGEFLKQLRIAIASGPTPTKSPTLVFALDVGPAGVDWTRRFVRQARAEGWKARAAHVRLDDEPGAKLDWNDLFQRGRLGYAARQDFLWHGDVLIAADEREKAFLIWQRNRYQSFHFVHEGRTWWASFPSPQRIADEIAEGFKDDPDLSIADRSVKEIAVVRRLMSVSCIANCAFRALYYERNETTDTSAYWLRIDRPGKYPRVKASFPGPALAGSGEFKKRLLSVCSGAIWTGDQEQLDRITLRQLPVRDVTGIEFTGYCRDHKAYVLGDIAIAGGKVYRPNEDGYFDIGKSAVKLRTSERLLDRIVYDPDRLDASWLSDFWTAWRARGLVILAFMGGLALCAEQVRQINASLGFLEVTGPPGAGKSTALEFIWKLLGREGYEGFDPAKATQAGIARELAKVANLPVVFIEGDRKEDVPHSKKFDWDETKTLYNGRATRTRGVRNDGLETYSPPFRGAFMIVQNYPVKADRAVMERIMSVQIDKSEWSDATKIAAERLENWPVEQASGFIVHFARSEPDILARYRERFPIHEARLLARPGVSNARLAKTHAQLAAMLDALPIVLPDLRPEWIAAAHRQIEEMAVGRHTAIATDHPHVELFWERIEWLEQNAEGDGAVINHHRDPARFYAISLPQFEERCAFRRLTIPPIAELKKHLKDSKRHRFLDAKTVNSPTRGSLHCWIFQRGDAPA